MKDFLDSNASGLVVVATLPADIQAHLQAKTTRVFLSSDTRDSDKKHKWTSEDFALLQELLDHGEVRTDRDNHIVVAHINGVWRCAAVKVTGDRKEVYLSSFHRMRAKQVLTSPTRGVRSEREGRFEGVGLGAKHPSGPEGYPASQQFSPTPYGKQ